MPACRRLDDDACSDYFGAEQGLRKGYVLDPPLFNALFTAALQVAEKRFSS